MTNRIITLPPQDCEPQHAAEFFFDVPPGAGVRTAAVFPKEEVTIESLMVEWKTERAGEGRGIIVARNTSRRRVTMQCMVGLLLPEDVSGDGARSRDESRAAWQDWTDEDVAQELEATRRGRS